MITVADYVGPHIGSKDWTPVRAQSAAILLSRVNSLIDHLKEKGVKFPTNPKTSTLVSGSTFGGFRPQSCPQGAPNSSHKEGQGVDLYDPGNAIDTALTDAILASFDLYREHPSATNSWVHLTTRAPGSRRRSFIP
jgi:hypothetical protein